MKSRHFLALACLVLFADFKLAQASTIKFPR